jgi:hypothetical protein
MLGLGCRSVARAARRKTMAADFIIEQVVRANCGGNFRSAHIPTAGGVKALESGAGDVEHGVRRRLPLKTIPS